MPGNGKTIRFSMIPNDLMEDADLTHAEYRLLSILIKHCNPRRDGGDFLCWPSNGTLAKKMRCTKSHAWRMIKSLEDKGFLVRSTESRGEFDRRILSLEPSLVFCGRDDQEEGYA